MIMSNSRLILIREGLAIDECKKKCDGEKIYEEIYNEGLIDNKERFSFVGIYSCKEKDNKGVVIVGYPKYIKEIREDRDILGHMNLVCRVIEKTVKINSKVLKKDDGFNSYWAKEENKKVELIKLADFILNDYVANGIYTCKVKKIKINGNGSTNWCKTISKINPIIETNSIIYPSTLNRVTMPDFSQIITEIHSISIKQCYYKIMKLLGRYEEIILPETSEAAEEFLNDNLSKYKNIIMKYISQVFSQRESSLLKALATWCDVSPYYDDITIGVNNFDKVWEETTKYVFGNINNTKSGEPRYTINGKTYSGKGEAEPDILNVFCYNDEKCIAILDAKYYFPKAICSDRIIGFPANSDIVKQVDYYNSIKERYLGLGFKYSNAFLVPEFSKYWNLKEGMLPFDLYRHIGKVERSTPLEYNNDPILVKLKVKNEIKCKMDFVLVYEVDATRLYKMVLEERKVKCEAIYEDFIIQFEK